MGQEIKLGIREKAKTTLIPLVAIGMLGVTQLACNFTEAINLATSPDPGVSFGRGFAGMIAIELECGAGKLIDYVLNKTTSGPKGCLVSLLLAIPPIATGVCSIEYPAVGYIALALPAFAAFSYGLQKIHDAKE